MMSRSQLPMNLELRGSKMPRVSFSRFSMKARTFGSPPVFGSRFGCQPNARAMISIGPFSCV